MSSHNDDSANEMSRRQQKKLVEQGVRELRNKPGWDPKAFVPTSIKEKLLVLDQQSSGERAYAGGQICADCKAEREKKNDDTALCERHLAEAMGF